MKYRKELAVAFSFIVSENWAFCIGKWKKKIEKIRFSLMNLKFDYVAQ